MENESFTVVGWVSYTTAGTRTEMEGPSTIIETQREAKQENEVRWKSAGEWGNYGELRKWAERERRMSKEGDRELTRVRDTMVDFWELTAIPGTKQSQRAGFFRQTWDMGGCKGWWGRDCWCVSSYSYCVQGEIYFNRAERKLKFNFVWKQNTLECDFVTLGEFLVSWCNLELFMLRGWVLTAKNRNAGRFKNAKSPAFGAWSRGATSVASLCQTEFCAVFYSVSWVFSILVNPILEGDDSVRSRTNPKSLGDYRRGLYEWFASRNFSTRTWWCIFMGSPYQKNHQTSLISKKMH